LIGFRGHVSSILRHARFHPSWRSATLSPHMRPGVDDLVVLFALGDQAVLILLLVVGTSALVSSTRFHLGLRDDHVVLAERDAGLEGVAEAELMIASQKITVSFWPQCAIDLSITSADVPSWSEGG
jgi:hypothetical protein